MEISIVLAPPRTLLLPCECVEVRSSGDQCSWHHDPVAPQKRHHRKEANNASSLDPSIDRSAAHLASFRPAPSCSPPAFPNTHPTVLASPTTWSFSTEFVFTASFRSLWEPAYRTSDSVNIVCLRQPSGALAQASAAPLTDVMSVKHQSLGTAAQVGCQQKCARPCGPWLHQPLSPPGRYFSQEAVIQQGTPPAALSSQMNSCFHKREP